MRKLLFISMLAGALFTLHAQVPVAFKYQAVVRNITGDIMVEKSVNLRISLLSGSTPGTVVYTENFTGKTTNKFGLVDIEIGKGTPVTGSFPGINWSTGTFFIKVEIDPSGGGAFQEMGTSPLLSVPFALHSKTVEQETDGDPVNEIQALTLNGNQLTLSKGGGTVNLPSSGGGDGWGTQTTVTDATLSGNGTVTSPLKIAQQSATSGQVLKWNGTAWSPASDVSGGGLVLPYSGTSAFASDPVFNITNSGNGSGIKGKSNATSGVYYGVIGESSSIHGTGVYGGAPNIGVEGIAHSGGGTAIYGYAYANEGTNYAIRGITNSSDGFAGFFQGGKVHISGNTGLGVTNPTAKLDIDGQLKIRGGTPGAGKVLTSNAEGLASWQTPGGGLTLPYNGSVSTTGEQAFSIWNTGSGNGIYSRANSGNGLIGQSQGGVKTSGVVGLAYGTGDNYGVSGSSNSTSGTGVSGSASSLTGTTIGVSGMVISADGYSGYFDGGKFYVSGNAGIGVTAPSAKLDVNGQIKIRGGSPGAGKVLTSDAAGLAAWTAPGELKLPYSDTVSTPVPLISICNSGSGNGILAISKQPTGTTCGIAGEAYSTLGAGLIGTSYATTGSNFGVKGKTYSADGYSGYFDGGRFYISGKTGIGTTSPSQRLHIKGDAPGNAVLLIEPNKWEAAGDYGELRFGDANHYIRGEHTTGMTFNDANKFTFKGGNVGIGMDNPAAKLDVSASQGPNLIIRDSDGGSGRPGIQFVNNDVHFIGSDDTNTEIFGFYSGYGNNRSNAARLNIHGPATNNWGKYIGLTHDGNHGRISTDAGYLVLEPAGQRVGVGTDAPTQSLDVNGTFRVRGMTTGSSAGTVYRTSDGTLITGASDIRLKEKIKPIENSLEKVLQLKGVTFAWKNDPVKRNNIGFIAQDFEKVIPELVFTNENDGYKGINYAEVTAILVEAIRELKNENDRLRDENRSFSLELSQTKEKFKILNNRLENIETILNSQAGK
jgi:hypothetical protein